MEQNTSILESIIKAIFSKDESSKGKLEIYINSTIRKNITEEGLKNIIIEYKNILFDPSKQFQQLIVKGDMSPILEMINVLNEYNPSPDNLFLLIHPIISIFKELDSKIIVLYSNHLNNILRNKTKLILKYFNEISEGLNYLKVHQDSEVRHCSKNLDDLLKETLTNAYKDMEKNDIEFNVKDFLQGLFEKLRTNHPGVRLFVVSWITLIGIIPQLKLIKVLPDVLPWLFNKLGDKTKDVNECSEKFLKMGDNWTHNYKLYVYM